jgi:hypothetical protein
MVRKPTIDEKITVAQIRVAHEKICLDLNHHHALGRSVAIQTIDMTELLPPATSPIHPVRDIRILANLASPIPFSWLDMIQPP